MEAAVAREYGEDATTLTLRQLVVRIDGLPVEDLEWVGWTHDREVAASTLEMVDAVRLVTTAANTEKKKRSKLKPFRVPRPTDKPKKKGSWVDALKDLARVKGG